MTDEQAARLIDLLEDLKRTTSTEDCCSGQVNCESQATMSMSAARFNEGATANALASLQNFTLTNQNAWQLQQRTLHNQLLNPVS